MSETFCKNHPDRPYIEKCEVCGDALCGYCLYYTEDGQRLCEKHAQSARANGLKVIPPAVYAQGIIPAQADATNREEARSFIQRKPKGAVEPNMPTFEGNNHDLGAFLAMVIGLVTLAACCGASYCMPIVAMILGVLALSNAKNAVDPARTRRHAWVGIATGGVFMLAIAAFCAFYVFVFAAGISASSNTFYTPYVLPTDTASPAPTATYTPAPGVEPLQLTATAKAPAD